MSRPARVIVNTHAVQANLEVVRACAPGAKVMAIVKADAYGHGIARIASALSPHVDAFGVASIEEALRVRAAKVTTPIVLLEGPFAAEEIDDIAANALETVVHTQAQVRWLEKAPVGVPVWVKIDSGMHRLGFDPAEAASAIESLRRSGRPVRLMTHLASTHRESDPSVTQQLKLFEQLVSRYPGDRSIANSGAVLGWPQCHANWVRPGIMLYGVSPFSGKRGADHGLVPAMTVVSSLIAVRNVDAGGSVGYGKAYVCAERMPVGVVAFGYGDGYPRHAATGTPVIVNGVRTQVIGEASMDMLTVDLRPVPRARPGDPVTLWGADLPVEEVAASAGTIPYELLCRVRMRARYVESVG